MAGAEGQAAVPSSGSSRGELEVLLAERARLENSVHHLVTSNHELKAALEEEFDRDFKEAIEVHT